MKNQQGIQLALLAALLFGASTPLAKAITGSAAPEMLAALLYLGSGLGLSTWLLWRRSTQAPGSGVTRRDLPWLAGAIAAGGVAGPVLLMEALARMPASAAALLLNMEGVLTALLAWFAFREQFDRRILLGMAAITAAGVLLAVGGGVATTFGSGAVLVVLACLCWAIDNNLTRKVSAGDAVQIAALKGLVAGSVNLAIAAWGLHQSVPAWPALAAAGAIGLLGYGLSLVCFVVALRHLGTARTGAYFSAAPFAGAALSILLLGERPGMMFWIAAALMAAGIWLHITERHDHEHAHEAMDHTHAHTHDVHHRHTHDFDWDGREPHVHAHHHAPLRHRHAHFPDIHHRHEH